MPPNLLFPQSLFHRACTAAALPGVLLSLLLSGLSHGQTATGAEQPSSEEVPVVTPYQQQMAELANAQPDTTEVLWLETQRESFLGLMHPANSGQPLGAILILPDDRTSPDWPVMVHDLRTQLPDLGWYTLAIELPPIPRTDARASVKLAMAVTDSDTAAPQASATSNASATAPDPSTPSSPTTEDEAAPDYADYAVQVNERISTALGQLSAQVSGQLVILGIGSGAYWGSRYLQSNPNNATYLTLIDASQPQAIPEPELGDLLAQITSPTLDLYHGPNLPDGNSEAQIAADQRRNTVIRSQRQGYNQRRLPIAPMAVAQQNQRLVQTLRGVYKKHLQDPEKSAPVTEAIKPSLKNQPPGTPRF